MYTEISNPMDYNAAFYIRLSKEDDSDKESESVTNCGNYSSLSGKVIPTVADISRFARN